MLQLDGMGTTLGEEFAKALAAKDFDRIATLLHPQVDFRGMTPGRSWEASSPQQVVDGVLRFWFEEHDRIDELLSIETGRLSDRDRVGYRFAVSNKDGKFITEQQAYYDVKDGAITWMRVLCSGWRPRETDS